MNKEALLNSLKEKLAGLPEAELKKSLDFYSEAIDDRMEDGLSEEEAVAAMGDVKDIANEILEDIPLKKLVKNKVKNVTPKRGLKPWEIVLLVLGSPVWLPITLALAIVFAVLVLVFYILYWVFILVFYVIDLCIAVGGVAGIAAGVFLIAKGEIAPGFFLIGSGFFLGGLSIPFFFLCNLIAKGMIALSKKIVGGIKWIFVGRKKDKAEKEENGKEAESGKEAEIVEEAQAVKDVEIIEEAEVEKPEKGE